MTEAGGGWMSREKGAYRSVYSSIWDDPEFQAFDADMMAVFFCLRTSKDCNFPCIFPHYHSTLHERMPNLQKKDVDRAVQSLLDAGWIRYERPILWIVKGLKNDPNFYPNNRNHVIGIANLLKTLPKLKIVLDFAQYYGIPLNSEGGGASGIDTGYESLPLWDGNLDTDPLGNQGKGKGTGKGKGINLRARTREAGPSTPGKKSKAEAAAEGKKLVAYYEEIVRTYSESHIQAEKNAASLIFKGESYRVLWECVGIYHDIVEGEKREDRYRKTAANFFGREATYKNYELDAKRIVEMVAVHPLAAAK